MLVKIDKDYAIIDLPKDKTRNQGYNVKLKGLDVMAGPPRRMEANLLGILAPDA